MREEGKVRAAGCLRLELVHWLISTQAETVDGLGRARARRVAVGGG